MHTVLWEYHVSDEKAAAFETFYGAAGPWVGLFRTGDGFIETVLLRDVTTPGRYVTLDRWDTADAYTRFQNAHGAEYAQIDLAAAALTSVERRLGSFES